MLTVDISAQVQRDALALVTHPQTCAEHPGLRLNAWAVLKAARQQSIDLHRLAAMRQRAEVLDALAAV